MSKYTDRLWGDLVREHGPTLAQADRLQPDRAAGAGFFRRPRILASGSLGLAGIGAALVLILSAGGAAAPPAFAITKKSDGSVLVKLNYAQNLNLPQLNRQLTRMGTHEQVTIYMASGPATVSGAVTCTPGPGAGAPNPPVKVLVGKNGTEVIAPGESGGNTAEGTFHLDHCTVAPASDTGPGTGNTGNTGAS
jgi:hypothetical protein